MQPPELVFFCLGGDQLHFFFKGSVRVYVYGH